MGPQYTSCVEEEDFSELNPAYLAVLGTIAVSGGLTAVLFGGLPAFFAAAALFEALRYIFNWMLHGKLICLHRNPSEVDCKCGLADAPTVCAIGEVTDTEHVGEDKNPIEDIDDDYAINLALYPFSMSAFVAKGYRKPDDDDAFWAYKQSLMAVATNPGQTQGDLLRRHVSKHGEAKKFGYLRTMVYTRVDSQYQPYNEVVGRDPDDPIDKWTDYLVKNAWKSPERYNVPVLHCEFEGSRTHDMLEVLEDFPFGSSFCNKNFLFSFICKVLGALLFPVVLVQLAAAWAGNTAGSIDPGLVGGGTIGPKDQVIVRGSWTYDAGHSGWNEVHAVRIVQKIENVPNDATAFANFVSRWCKQLADVPTVVTGVGVPASPAGVVGTEALPPQDRWTHHPFVDGCSPKDGSRDQPTRGPIIK
jgi:hypothetical protein